MKTLEIVGANYFGSWTKQRWACRAVVIRDNHVLLSYETVTDQWMIPGGGREPGEDEAACCVREVAEETGYIIEPSPCVLELEEYYEDCRYVDRYFFGAVTGCCERQLTDRERAVGMEPRWLPVEEALAIFSRHADCAATDEMRRGMYLREFTALLELLKER